MAGRPRPAGGELDITFCCCGSPAMMDGLKKQKRRFFLPASLLVAFLPSFLPSESFSKAIHGRVRHCKREKVSILLTPSRFDVSVRHLAPNSSKEYIMYGYATVNDRTDSRQFRQVVPPYSFLPWLRRSSIAATSENSKFMSEPRKERAGAGRKSSRLLRKRARLLCSWLPYLLLPSPSVVLLQRV